ncbi:MAG: VRR-NUC domain-containing protein [Candidatus Accumulibacter phosphatis]|uniref:VRR-NUC domain-containing protein n=1 Tax=Candidatus Accumulibacter phosphatis TaxID=327160 RepID=UPI001A57B1A3|nr:VRR-NUC domain-containing protein [Candidatus Accumulibacter phosphatis]
MTRAVARQQQAALFDDLPPQALPPRRNDRAEAAALAEVLQTLRHHPAVAWVRRQNSGVARIGDRFVRFGWPGCSDILGQLIDGRLLAVECKAPKGRLQAEQAAFLDLVRRFGGVAFQARDCRDAQRWLDQHQNRQEPPADPRCDTSSASHE